MNRLSQISERLALLSRENPCGWSDSVLNSIADGISLMMGERTKHGINMMEMSEYYHVTIRTIERWRLKYDDFPCPIDPYAKTLSFPVDSVVQWKFDHPELF